MAKYKAISKSRKNKSGRKSPAAKMAEVRARKNKNIYSSKTKKKTKVKPKKKTVKKIEFKAKPLNARTPIILPETELTRKGMTLRKLMRNTPRLFVNNARYVNLIDYKFTKTKTGMPAHVATMITVDPNQPGRKIQRKVHVLGLDRGKEGQPLVNKPVNKHRKVMVQCSCQAYVFYGAEYANALHGAARIIYGNGQPPDFTNPSYVPHLCKHAFSFSKFLVLKDK